MTLHNRLRYLASLASLVSATSMIAIALADERISVASNSRPATIEQRSSENTLLVQLQPLPGCRRCPVVTAMAVDESNQTMAAAGDDHAIRWIDLTTGKILAVFAGHEDWVRQVRFLTTDDGSLKLLSCGDDGKIFVWNWSRLHDEVSVDRSTVLSCDHTLSTIAVNTDCSMFAAGGFSNTIYVGSLNGKSVAKEFICSCGDQRSLLFSDDSHTLFTGGRDGAIHVIDLQSFAETKDLQVHQGRIRSLTMNQDGVLSSVGEDRVIHCIDWRTGESLLSTKLKGGKLLAVEPMGDDRLVVASADNTVQIIDSKTGEEINRLIGHDGSVAVLLYQNRRLFTAGFDTTIRIWNMDKKGESKATSTKLIHHSIQGRFPDSGVSEVTN